MRGRAAFRDLTRGVVRGATDWQAGFQDAAVEVALPRDDGQAVVALGRGWRAAADDRLSPVSH